MCSFHTAWIEGSLLLQSWFVYCHTITAWMHTTQFGLSDNTSTTFFFLLFTLAGCQ